MNNYLDLQFKSLANKEFYRGLSERKYWTMKDGSKIIISEMETSHIRNCLRLIRTGSVIGRTSNYIHAFEDELIMRGEKI